MNIVKQIPAYLLAVAFLVFGLNFFLHFFPIPSPENPDSDSAKYMALMMNSGYMKFVKVLEVVGAVLLFIPRTRAIGLCIIVPIVVNIFAFHTFIDGKATDAIVWIVLSVLAIYFDKDKFSSMLS
ncbi:hypothetical protein VB796_04155 [Arcicella sp. LKC2W]|uniref:hypothetical protein n=1 Tax=Arcicella sp. LKC2W TaxID=2984198 RepID=UPI002B21FC5E|nr:hypothetical protein [Arcicella sp. LKC2W]MEA5458213.1 hypothetical protein [Arcicella sp. LKC2W]